MADPLSNRSRRLLTNYVVALALWLVSTLLTILAVLYGRIIVMAAFGLTHLNYWGLSFVDRAGMLILGLIGLGCALFFEYYYRMGVERRQLWPRFVKVTIVQLLIIAVGLAISFLDA